MTIVEAVKAVMKAHRTPMTANEIYAAMFRDKLYEFYTDSPTAVVAAQLRRHSAGASTPSSSKAKHFRATGDGRYELLAEE